MGIAIIVAIVIIFIAIVNSLKKDDINVLPGKIPGELLVLSEGKLIATIKSSTNVIWHTDDLNSWIVSDVLDIAAEYEAFIKNLNDVNK